MAVQTRLEKLLYFALLIGGLVFSWQSISEYMKGSTSYLITQELISLGDFPTLVVCIPKLLHDNYGNKRRYKSRFIHTTDLFINGIGNEEKKAKSIFLQQNSWVKTWSVELHLSEMHEKWDDRQQCYKISSKWKKQFDLKNFKFRLGLQCANASDLYCNIGYWRHEIYVYPTSESNSYGIAGRRWFDRYVNIQKSRVLNGQIMRITEIKEYRNLDALCVEDSYYECLAKRLKATGLLNQTKCPELCSPFSLPTVNKYTIPICRQVQCGLIMENKIQDLQSSQTQVCKKACQVKEFKFGDVRDLMPGYQYNPTEVLDLRLWEMEIKFDTPFTTKDIRSDKPFKKVMTEYHIVNTLSLVGVVGGTLGMFAGFSFFGLTEWLIVVAFVKLQELKKILLKGKPKSQTETENIEIV